MVSSTVTTEGEYHMTKTKNDLARSIIQALYNMPIFPAASNPLVVCRAKLPMKTLIEQYRMAVAAMNSVTF